MRTHKNISVELLKSVLAIYFIITLLATLIHFVIEYNYTEKHIRDELKIVAETFYPALQTALWDLNSEQIESIANGMMHLPLVYGITIVDSNHLEMVKKKDPALTKDDIKDKDLSYKCDIYQKYDNNDMFLAQLIIYSDTQAIYDRLKVGFSITVLNDFIKSLALILLFMLAFKRELGIPLQLLTQKISTLNWKSRENRKIDIEFRSKNELYFLLKKFNELLSKISSEEDKRFELIHHLNQELEQEVQSRTQELQQANEELRKLATTDFLTQLNNRIILDKELQLKFDNFARHHKVFSLIMIDVDFFKNINDTYGHLIGDSVLKEIAAIIKENIRNIDIAGRWGGEEFLIICDHTTLDGAYILAEKIRKKIQNHKFEDVDTVSASFGVAQIELEKDITIDRVLKKADDALYKAKNNGRNKTIKGV